MKKLDETEIIRIFQNRFGRGIRFIADDVENIKISGIEFAVKSDMLVQSTDVPPKMSLKQIARKSVVSCISDFACKGIQPKYATISLALPKHLTRNKIKELADGFTEVSDEFNIQIIGGDVNEGIEIVIEVSMFGLVKKKIPTRRGAKIGDVILTSGPFGYTASGLKIVLDKYKAKRQFLKKCEKMIMNPRPRLEFGLKASRYFSSSMDSSDGLSITLNELSDQSRKRFVLFNIPTTPEVIEFSRQNEIELEELIFCGGEEYEIVFTTSPQNLQKIQEIAKKFKVDLFEIGHVTKGKNVVLAKNDKSETIKKCGWVHLRS